MRLRLSANGSVLVQAVANEIGRGTATVQIQQVADRMGVPIEKVSFQYGDRHCRSRRCSRRLEPDREHRCGVTGGGGEDCIVKLLTLAGEASRITTRQSEYEQIEAA